MLGQVIQGRTADDVAYWLLSAPVCLGGHALLRARIAVDLFHVVQAAVKANMPELATVARTISQPDDDHLPQPARENDP